MEINVQDSDVKRWAKIPGHNPNYEVSTFGRVRSCIAPGSHRPCNTWHVLKLSDKQGYKRVYVGGERKVLESVHRLVAMAFIPNPDNLPCINHKDENPSNNMVSNLEWCTIAYNSNYGTARSKISKALTNHPAKSKQVFQFTLDGKLVAKYPSAHEASRATGLSRHVIAKRLTGTTMSDTTGYIWSYTEIPRAAVSRYSLYKTREVDQYTLTGDFVRTWPSISIAARELNIKGHNISSCCAGKRHKVGGYIWRYKDEKVSI